MTVSRFRLLDRYIVREILPPTGLGLVLFTFVLLLQRLTYLAAILISRSADLPTTLALVWHSMPVILSLTIPMAFLLGVLLAFGRLASESEVVAMRASGVSPLQMLRPVLLLGATAGLATFYMTAIAQPRSASAWREALHSLVLGKARAGIRPKVFADNLVPGMAVYVSDIDEQTGEWRDVFIADQTKPEWPRVILARRGHLALDEERKLALLKLRDATTHAHSREDPSQDYRESFGTAKIPITWDQIFPREAASRSEHEMSLRELAREAAAREAAGGATAGARYRMFLHRRLAIPVACIVFGVLGLALSLGYRKEARSAAFGLSLAVICVYYILLRTGEQAAANGLVRPWIGVWAANAVFGVAAVGLLALRQREGAFDPLSASHYVAWWPRFRSGGTASAAATSGVRSTPAEPAPERTASRRFGPGLLDRYVARYFAGFGLLVLVALWLSFVLFDYMDIFDDVHQNRVPGRVVTHYYAFVSPMIVQMMAPFAALIGTLATFGVLARRNEIVAMLASGVSLFRVAAPVVVLAALASGLMFGIGEYVIPHTNRTAQNDRDRIKGRPAQSSTRHRDRWIVGSDGRIYYYEYFSEGVVAKTAVAGKPASASLHGLSVFDVDPVRWELRERLEAAAARWTGLTYELERGWRRRVGAAEGYRSFTETRTREIDPPAYFRREARDAEALPFFELRAHIAFMDERGADVVPLQVQLYRKLALPLTILVMVLLGIRFAFTVGRRGALYGIGVSVAIAITFLVAVHLFEAMGNHGLLPPFLAAWAPNLLFGMAGLYLMSTLET